MLQTSKNQLQRNHRLIFQNYVYVSPYMLVEFCDQNIFTFTTKTWYGRVTHNTTLQPPPRNIHNDKACVFKIGPFRFEFSEGSKTINSFYREAPDRRSTSERILEALSDKRTTQMFTQFSTNLTNEELMSILEEITETLDDAMLRPSLIRSFHMKRNIKKLTQKYAELYPAKT